MLKLIHLIVLYLIVKHPDTPTIFYLIGNVGSWDGVVNQFLKQEQISLFQAQPIRSMSGFQKLVAQLRDEGYLQADGHHLKSTDRAVQFFERAGNDWKYWQAFYKETLHDPASRQPAPHLASQP